MLLPERAEDSLYLGVFFIFRQNETPLSLHPWGVMMEILRIFHQTVLRNY